MHALRCSDCATVGPFPERVRVRQLSPTGLQGLVREQICGSCWDEREHEIARDQERRDTVTDDNGKPIGRRIDLERPPRPRTVPSMPSGAITGWQRTGWNRRVP